MTWAVRFAEGDGSPKETPINYRRLVLTALGKSLIIPVLLLIFFFTAPAWLNYKTHSEITEAIQSSRELSDSEKATRIAFINGIDFRQLDENCPPQLERMRERLTESGLIATFHRLRWGQYLSLTLVGLLAATVAIMLVLNIKARRSPTDLLASYRLGCRLGTALGIIKVCLLIPLLGYGTFEFSVLLSNHYFPKLILLIVGGGLFALWRCGSVLFAKVPLEFTEPLARSVTEQEAPVLWRVVRDAAARLQTEPPDHILIGMQLNFYVTEFAVNHDSGRSEGRTLYLSHPVLKMLSPDEVTAIIGHEFGHFIGQDTRMTREFYPLRHKMHGPMIALAQSGWAAWPSFEFLNFFTSCFEETVQASSRQRELLADQIGAKLTAPEVQARALVRFHILIEAFERGVTEALRQKSANPLDFSLQSVIREKLLPDTKFWSQLSDQKSPHPLDSHPPLHVRIEGLGYTFSVESAQQIALEEFDTAYARWLDGKESLFTSLTEKTHEALGKVRVQREAVEADHTTAEGKELLNQHFPKIYWEVRPTAFWLPLVFVSVIGLIFLIAAIASGSVLLLTIFSGGTFLLLLYAIVHWNRLSDGFLSIDALGILHSGWSRPILFTEVESLTFGPNNLLTLKMKEKQSIPWKFRLFSFSLQNIAVKVGDFDGKPEEIAQTIYRYFTRQIKE